MNTSSLQKFLLFSLLVIILWSAIHPADPLTWWLEAFPVAIALPLLIVSRETFPLTPMIYILVFCHMAVLLIGAHYTYAEVPAGNWAKEYFHLSRNHYDRFGHFMQGFVPALIARELLLRTSPLKAGKWMVAIILLGCLGISALYEIFEWTAAALTGQAADAFLATQGDPWDTQKDMLTALIGAAAALALLGRHHDRALEKIRKTRAAQKGK